MSTSAVASMSEPKIKINGKGSKAKSKTTSSKAPKQSKTKKPPFPRINANNLTRVIDERVYWEIKRKGIKGNPNVPVEKRLNGTIYDLRGKEFQKLFAETMENASNLRRYKSKGTKRRGGNKCYFLFKMVMDKLDVDASAIDMIYASTQIPIGEDGRKPKTDVSLAIKQIGSKEVDFYTFSLKYTTKQEVSAHQYDADVFANVLNERDDHLRELLREIQLAGGPSKMSQNDRYGLIAALKPYLNKLNQWVLSGRIDKEDEGPQYTDYLLYISNGMLSLSTVDEYCDYMKDARKTFGNLDTIFRWTRHKSGKSKIESIQLKMKLNA